MTRALRWAVIAVIVAAARAAPAAAADPAPAADGAEAGPAGKALTPPFTADDLVLLEVRTDNLEISDGLDAYASRAGVYLPLGQLARLLDLAITVSPPEGRADGWALSPSQIVSVDLGAGTAVGQGHTFRLERWQAVQVQDEIYVRSDLLEKLLPLKVKADISALALTITPLTPFPFQERLAREQARKGLAAGAQSSAMMRVATPYELFTPPSADLTLSVNGGNDATGTTTQYQVRLAGDLLYAGAQVYAGSNDRGGLSDVRALLERKDPEGRIGPLHATRAGVGDVFTPALTLGARGASGRGFYMTSEPIEQPSVLGHIDVRGELQLGWDVELYLNELLFRSQATPVDGRYEFVDVPLSFGLNTLRLVFYGPRGERREEVRRLNFGGGLLAKGRSIVRFGAVEEGVNLIDVGQGAAAMTPLALNTIPGLGHWRVTGAVDYGLSTNLTLSAAVAQFTPRINDTRQLFTAGVRTSLDGVALLTDVAHDSAGGTAASLGAVGRLDGVAFSLRHAEYSGGFVDELRPHNLGGGAPVQRSSEVGLEGQVALSRGRLDLPYSLLVGRDQLINGDTFITATARTSMSIQAILASTSLSYIRSDTLQSGMDQKLSAAVDISGVLRDRWRVRAGLITDLAPDLQAQSAVVTLDRELGNGSALRFGVSHNFSGASSTNLQVGGTWRLDMADISATAGYDTGTRNWRIGFQVSTGLLFDPLQRRYRSARPGVAAGGNLALLAFIDENGDGVAQPGEARVPGLKVSGGYRETDTDALGRLIISALGDGAYVRVRVDPESIDNPFVSLPPTEIQFTPRPGRVTVAPYAMRITGEVELHMMLRDSAGAAHGLSALGVQLVDGAGKVAAGGRTEYDGTLILEGLPAGTYGLRLDPEQASRLRLSLEAPQSVVIKAGGGFVGTRTAYIRIN
jgi:hypothetical protein